MGLSAIAPREFEPSLAIAAALAFIRRVTQILAAAARKGISGAASRRRSYRATIDTSRRQRASMNCLGENARDFL